MIDAQFTKNITTSHGKICLDIKLTIQQGEFVSLFGPSGSGKTTILRILAGLANPQEGKIIIDKNVWFDHQENIQVPTQQRSIGFVFQEYNLFPHMTLRENLLFALEPHQSTDIADHYLDLIHLSQVQHLKPAQLSGGQQQRAALVRALIRKPKILLLDEPFSSLDLETRWRLQEELLKMHAQERFTTIFVSHDVVDVMRLSKRIFVLSEGKLFEQEKLPIPPQLQFLSNDK